MGLSVEKLNMKNYSGYLSKKVFPVGLTWDYPPTKQ